jgi:hypothetical protein
VRAQPTFFKLARILAGFFVFNHETPSMVLRPALKSRAFSHSEPA